VIIFLLVRNRARRKRELLEKEHDLFIKEAFIRASIQSQERERKRFAQDLHDGMGQLISSIGLLLVGINSDSSLETRLSVVTKSEKIIEEMQQEIRGVAFNLMPQTLIQLGLSAALKEMALRASASGKITISANAFEVPERLAELQEISLYRIIQEWVNNIMK
jgi:signal transduction histidine kinase